MKVVVNGANILLDHRKIMNNLEKYSTKICILQA